MKHTLEEITKEYQQTCFQAGQVQYQITVLNRELDKLNDKLHNLNVDASKLEKKAAEEKVKVELPETQAEEKQ